VEGKVISNKQCEDVAIKLRRSVKAWWLAKSMDNPEKKNRTL